MKNSLAKTAGKKDSWRSLSGLLFGLAILLSLLGLFFIFEASSAESYQLFGHQYYFLRQQATSLLLGLTAMFAIQWLPTVWWRKTAGLWFVVGIVLLILVFVPGLGVELNGAHRWLSFQGRLFQPVEVFKIILILFCADWMTKHQKPATFLFLTGLFSFLMLMQPDLGSLLILLWIIFGMFFLAGGKLLMLGGIAAAGIMSLLVLIFTSPYRLERLTTYLNPELDPLGSGFHVRQITLALAHGGWFGVGIGNSQQKYAYIPEVSSDSIFAIVAEEIGFIGSSLMISLLLVFVLTIYRMAMRLPEGSFSQLLVLGVFLWLSGQALLNLAAVTVLVPLTGLPLPFFSSGGTSLMTILLAVGMVIKIFREQATDSVPSRRTVQSSR